MLASKMLGALELANPVTITSESGVLTLTSDSNDFIAAGTEAVTSITGWTTGQVQIRWNTVRTITYNATSLILQGATDRTTAIGDIGVYQMTSDGAREVNYFPVAASSGVIRTTIAVPIRQTVLSGPVNSSGCAVNLSAVSEDLAISELSGTVTTWANGYDQYGAVDYVQKLTSDVASAWSDLTVSSTLYLYKDYDASTEAVTYGFTTLAPVYQNYAPTSPLTYQYWFDTTNMVGYYYSGSAWVSVVRVFVGECVTGTSSVSSVTCYAYKGKYISAEYTPVKATITSAKHNIGVIPCISKVCLKCVTTEGGYSVGDYFGGWGTDSAWGGETSNPTVTRTTISITTGSTSTGIYGTRKDTGAGFNITLADWRYIFSADRGW